jgi:uncharacterized protein
VSGILDNAALLACLVAWSTAQLSKVFIHLLVYRRLHLRFMLTSGGMPSSHAAVVVALATRIGVDSGLQTAEFALASIFAAVVMYDAAGVRRAVSIQARIMNRMLTELMEAQQFNERRLRELIGHTPFEVFVGGLLGALVAVSWS